MWPFSVSSMSTSDSFRWARVSRDVSSPVLLDAADLWVRSAVRFSRAFVCASSGTESVRKAMATSLRKWPRWREPRYVSIGRSRSLQLRPHRILNLVEQQPHGQRVARRRDFLRGSTPASTNQTAQVESRQAGIPDRPSSGRLKVSCKAEPLHIRTQRGKSRPCFSAILRVSAKLRDRPAFWSQKCRKG